MKKYSEMCREDRDAFAELQETRDEFDDGPWLWELTTAFPSVLLILAFIALVVSIFKIY